MIKVKGNRVIIEKDKIDCGGLKLTPNLEEDGQKNVGKIVNLNWRGLLRGFRKGQTIRFHKYFITNSGQTDEMMFVELDEILAIIK